MPVLRSLLLGMMLLFGAGPAAHAQPAGAVSEDVLKAVLLFKLPLYIQHDDDKAMAVDPPRDLVICVLGRTTISETLKQLAQTPVEGRSVDLRLFRAAEQAHACDLIFVARSETVRLDQHLSSFAAWPAVTVSDIPGFAAAGGMVEFALRGDGPGLSILINRGAALERGLEFSAQLLRLARIVGE